VNTAAFAPMARAMDVTAIVVRSGERRRMRAA
jgi:hypothetical protein